MKEKIHITLAVIASVASILAVIISTRLAAVTLNEDLLLKTSFLVTSTALALALGVFYKWFRNREHLTVFISHSMLDAKVARDLAQKLKGENFSIILPEDNLEIGDNIKSEVNKQIASSDSFIALLSPSAIKSEWVQKELTIALDKQRKIYPILFEGAEIPTSLKDVLYIKFDNASLEEIALKLKKAIRNQY